MKKNKTILLTFDVEEFDTPLRHGIPIDESTQMQKGLEGLQAVLRALEEKNNPPSTFYTTAHFANHYPDMIKQVAVQHEIASHAYYHSRFEQEHLKSSKQALEQITGKNVFGFRMPNMASVDKKAIAKAGYLYDSSINPTYLPGKYNYLKYSIRPFYHFNILEIPSSVVPFVRFPLFWLSFKNLPLRLFILLCNITLSRTGFLNLYFHPWEFADLSAYRIPGYIIQPHGEKLIHKLKKFIEYYQAKEGVQFKTTADFYHQIKKP